MNKVWFKQHRGFPGDQEKWTASLACIDNKKKLVRQQIGTVREHKLVKFKFRQKFMFSEA